MGERSRKPLKLGRSYGVAFSPDSALLTSFARNVGLWSVSERRKLWWSHPLSHPSNVAFSPDAERLTVKATDGRIVVLSTVDGAMVLDCDNAAEGEGANLLFSPDGEVIVDGSWGGVLTFRSSTTGEIHSATSMPGTSFTWIRAAASDTSFWTLSCRKPTGPTYLQRWSWLPGAPLIDQFEYPGLSVAPTALDPVGELLATIVCDDAEPLLRVTHLRDSSLVWQRPMRPDVSTGQLHWNRDGTALAKADMDGWTVHSATTGHVLGSLPGQFAESIDFTEDGEILALGSWEGGLLIDRRSLNEGSPPEKERVPPFWETEGTIP